MYVCTTRQWHPMHVLVEPGSSTATKWNWNVVLETTDAGVDGEVVRGSRDMQDEVERSATRRTKSNKGERPLDPSTTLGPNKSRLISWAAPATASSGSVSTMPPKPSPSSTSRLPTPTRFPTWQAPARARRHATRPSSLRRPRSCALV